MIAFLQLVFAFPAPIALALLLHSLLSDKVKRLVQTDRLPAALPRPG